jgi:hypothetical protein
LKDKITKLEEEIENLKNQNNVLKNYNLQYQSEASTERDIENKKLLLVIY